MKYRFLCATAVTVLLASCNIEVTPPPLLQSTGLSGEHQAVHKYAAVAFAKGRKQAAKLVEAELTRLSAVELEGDSIEALAPARTFSSKVPKVLARAQPQPVAAEQVREAIIIQDSEADYAAWDAEHQLVAVVPAKADPYEQWHDQYGDVEAPLVALQDDPYEQWHAEHGDVDAPLLAIALEQDPYEQWHAEHGDAEVPAAVALEIEDNPYRAWLAVHARNEGLYEDWDVEQRPRIAALVASNQAAAEQWVADRALAAALAKADEQLDDGLYQQWDADEALQQELKTAGVRINDADYDAWDADHTLYRELTIAEAAGNDIDYAEWDAEAAQASDLASMFEASREAISLREEEELYEERE